MGGRSRVHVFMVAGDAGCRGGMAEREEGETVWEI